MSNLNFIQNVIKGKDFTELYELFSSTKIEAPQGTEAHSLLSETVKCNHFVIKSDPKAELSIRGVIAPLLKLFNREDIEIVLIDSDEVGAYYLSGVAIGFTYGLLNGLTDLDELLGITAHELAHQVFCKLSFEAIDKKCANSLKQIEFLCDSLGTLALIHLGLNTSGLVTFLTKNPAMECRTHPASVDRITLIEGLQ